MSNVLPDPRDEINFSPRRGAIPEPGELDAQLDKLLETLVEENRALQDPAIDFVDVSFRTKQQLFSQLSRFSYPEGEDLDSDVLQQKIRRVKTELEENEKILKSRLSALENVTDLISSVIRDHESDGTYDFRSGQDPRYPSV